MSGSGDRPGRVDALITSGAVVEVTVAAGVTRYALAESFATATAGEEL